MTAMLPLSAAPAWLSGEMAGADLRRLGVLGVSASGTIAEVAVRRSKISAEDTDRAVAAAIGRALFMLREPVSRDGIVDLPKLTWPD